ncbi:MAG TPA: ABC transporter substrate-binding protein [Stellaceae bacterium]|nr:ABC transporter substrate-binding protein [Stellaceae bacterium]
MRGRAVAAVGVALLLFGAAAPSPAADELRIGKAAAVGFSFGVLDVGIAQGFYKDAGIDIEELNFSGAAKVEQGIAAGAVDIGLSAGTDLALIVKGVPAKGVAALAGPPYDIAVIVGKGSPIGTLDDLKGKRTSAATAGGSMMEWMAKELARVKGWPPDSITVVAVGVERTGKVAALRTHAVDALYDAPGLAFELEKTGEGKLLALASDYVKDFMVHGIYASNALIAQNPEALRRFLAAWFKTIAFMRTHRAETVAVMGKVTGEGDALAGREYDLEMPMFSSDGRFDPAALKKLSDSFVELKMLDHPVDLAPYVTEKFLPVKSGS